MDRLKSIVVGIDFSAASVAALKQAARMAHWNDAALHVIHVRSPFGILAPRGEQELRDLLPERDWPSETRFDLPKGSPLELILRKLVEVDADLLVLGLYGSLGPFTGRGPGAVARRCLRQAPSKVMLVQESDTGPFARVLGCVDFSENSDLAVEQALRVALQDGSELHLLHVVREEAGSTPEVEQRLRHVLDRLESDAAGVKVKHCVAPASSSAQGILHYSSSNDVDLIVLGVRGQTNLRFALLGETAERALDQLPCSVLAIKPRNFVSPFTLLESS